MYIQDSFLNKHLKYHKGQIPFHLTKIPKARISFDSTSTQLQNFLISRAESADVRVGEVHTNTAKCEPVLMKSISLLQQNPSQIPFQN